MSCCADIYPVFQVIVGSIVATAALSVGSVIDLVPSPKTDAVGIIAACCCWRPLHVLTFQWCVPPGELILASLFALYQAEKRSAKKSGTANVLTARAVLLLTAAWIYPSMTACAMAAREMWFVFKHGDKSPVPSSFEFYILCALSLLSCGFVSPDRYQWFYVFVECLELGLLWIMLGCKTLSILETVSNLYRRRNVQVEVVAYQRQGELCNLIEPQPIARPCFSMDIHRLPFQFGAMRLAYYTQNIRAGNLIAFADLDWIVNCPSGIVLKRYYVAELPPEEMTNLYKEDLSMQYTARKYAVLYNAAQPPKPVTFVHAAVVKINDELWWIEPRLVGEYRKFSNNSGWTDTTRNTPHCFSHFSYEKSKGEVVVVDMQGVDEAFTDPQIHTHLPFWKKLAFFVSSDARKKYGAGNLGEAGIKAWKSTHQCTGLCEMLKLKRITPSASAISQAQAQAPAAPTDLRSIMTSTVMRARALTSF